MKLINHKCRCYPYHNHHKEIGIFWKRKYKSDVNKLDAFSLIELLLSISILLFLFSIGLMFNTKLLTDKKIENSVDQFVTLIRMCQIEAANSGKIVKMCFELEEPDVFDFGSQFRKITIYKQITKLDYTSSFEVFNNKNWINQSINDYLHVKSANIINFNTQKNSNFDFDDEDTLYDDVDTLYDDVEYFDFDEEDGDIIQSKCY
jgi:Tfp pilus assembly protein FimT